MADFQAFLVTTVLTLAAVTVSGTTPELYTTTGDTVNIPCLFGEGTLRHIFWYYNGDNGPQKILLLSNGVLAIDPEYADRASLQNNNSTLILREITVADEGTYRCDVDRQGQTVVTNINTNLNVFSLRPDTLPVITPCTVSDESSSCSIHANQSFILTATLSNVYPVEDTTLTWCQDGQRVSFTNDVNTQNDDGTTDISIQIQVSETGSFTCNATYVSANGRENTARSVEAWIMSLPDVPNTPGKYMTSGDKVLITISIVMIVLGSSVLLITTYIRYRLKARGQQSSRKETNKSDGTQLCQVTSEEPLIRLETSAETGSKNKYVSSNFTEETGTDDILMAIAEKMHDDHTNQLGKELGFDKVEIERYVARNSRYMNLTYAGTLAMLRDWDKKRFKARERAALKKALMAIGLDHLADNFLSEEGSGQQREATTGPSAAPSPNRSNKREVTNDEITRLSELLPAGKYSELCVNLGFGYGHLQNTLAKNFMDSTAAFKETLHEWKNKGGYMEDLDAALIKAELGGLVLHYKNYTPTKETKYANTSTTEEPNFDTYLIQVAKKIPKSAMDEFGKKLGFDTVEIRRYIGKNSRFLKVTCKGTLAMLRDWANKQTKATERAALKKALNDAGLVRFAEELFKEEGSVEGSTLMSTSTVPQGESLISLEQIRLTEKQLRKLAGCLPAEYSKDVAINLGVSSIDHENTQLRNPSIKDATFKMLKKWEMTAGGGKMSDLDKALKEANCGGIKYKDV